MARGSLSNNLLEQFICPAWRIEHAFNDYKVAWPARIVAAWIEEGVVKVQAVDDRGRTGEFFLSNVRLFMSSLQAGGYSTDLKNLKAKLERQLMADNPDREAITATEAELNNL